MHEKSGYVSFQIMPAAIVFRFQILNAADEFLQAPHPKKRPFAGSTSVAVMNKIFFAMAFDGAREKMIDDAITEISGENFPNHRFCDSETNRRSGFIGTSA